MSGRLLDEGMNQVSDRRWQVKVLPHPDISTSDSGDRVTISDFLAGVRRPLDCKAVKSASVITHVGIVECGDGCMNVLKILYLEKTVPSKAAMAFFAAGMAQNKSCGVSGAQSLTEFPLNTYNFNEDLVKHILPLNEAFVTVDEDGTVEGRYCEARHLRNQMRAYASNDTGEDPKDTKPGDTTLSTDSFMKLVHPLFGDAHLKDKFAVLKRSTVLVVTESALYLRFPSENPDFIIHSVLVYAPEYQAQVDKELEMIKASVETMSSFSSREAYVSHCNTQVQTWLRPTRHLPASPEDASDEDPNTQRASMGLPPVFPAIGNGPRPNRLGTFIYPSPAKRTRVKTPSIEPLPGAETNQGINVAADVGMTADEESPLYQRIAMGKSIINNVLPKKGKLRSVQKRPAAKISTTWKDVKYVREKCTVGPRGQRKDQIKWERTLHQLLRASDEEIINIQVNPEMGGHDLPYLLK
ncbi:unnamed protein product, partial [Symbiodinium microadriaticum]